MGLTQPSNFPEQNLMSQKGTMYEGPETQCTDTSHVDLRERVR